MTGTGTFTSLGNPSKTTILAYEEDKLSIEFTAAGTIRKGVPVMLNTTGGVIEWTKASLQHLCIGIALSSQVSGELITIATRAYAMVFGITSGALVTGIATYNGYDSTHAGPDGFNTGFGIWIAGTDVTDTIGWAIDAAAAQYALVRVLIKD